VSGHRHRAVEAKQKDTCWTHCVDPHRCDSSGAHGNITRVDYCACGAVRETEINAGHTRGEWHMPEPRNLGGRPVTVGADAQVLIRGPHELLEAVARRSEVEGVTTSEGWRRAARDWLGRD